MSNNRKYVRTSKSRKKEDLQCIDWGRKEDGLFQIFVRQSPEQTEQKECVVKPVG